jgi:uncharacterized glyoxalase superfamily protein PhnB
MNPPPPNWPRISSSVFYADAAAAIDWLCAAFGFAVRLKVVGDDGRIEHSELVYGDGVVMISQQREAAGERAWKATLRSPRALGGAGTQSLMVYVDDAAAHCAQARAAGARIVDDLATHDYGADYWTDRSYGALDPEGHLWWFTQRLRTADPA